MNVCGYLLEDKPESSVALLTLRGEYSYGQLRIASASVAASLIGAGARKGERVLLVAENGFFWVAAYLGILRAGLVCVPLPPTSSAGDLEHIIAVAGTSFAAVEARTLRRVPALQQIPHLLTDTPLTLDEHASVTSLGDILSADVVASGEPTPMGEEDLAALMFTSGSTGKPRGVMISHRNIIANTDSIIQYLSLTSRDRIMTVLPFHYCFGTSLLHTHLRAGASIVIDPRFLYPEVVLQRMQETACTGFAGVPSHFQILLRKSKLARMALPSLRYVQQAGGRLAPCFIPQLRDALPGKQIFIMYGQTEATARLSYLPPEMLDAKLGSIGRGMPGVELSVVDERGTAVKPGETGEIVARGENIALGYWRDEEETARCFRGGQLYTGDLATIDDDGFIYIVDRAKEFLKCGGKRVSSRYLEEVLLGCEDLLEAAIVGVPDEVLGEAAVAYVVPRDRGSGLNEVNLLRYCREHLPPPFVPRRFVLVDALPKNSAGKILKPLLKMRALGDQAASAGDSQKTSASM